MAKVLLRDLEQGDLTASYTLGAAVLRQEVLLLQRQHLRENGLPFGSSMR